VAATQQAWDDLKEVHDQLEKQTDNQVLLKERALANLKAKHSPTP